MKLSKNQLTRAYIYEPISHKDKEGYSVIEYPFRFVVDVVVKNEISKLEAQSYGEKVNQMKVCYLTDEYLKENVHEGWGIGFEDEEEKPDYKIVSIYPYQSHTRILVERV